MTDGAIVVTGANSYLGGRTVDRLRHYRVTALVSPRWNGDEIHSDVRYMASDLRHSVPDKALDGALRVFHFAWMRGKDLASVIAANRAMVDNLFESLGDASRLVFISSVAGSPGARSVYGRAKAAIAQHVRQCGGTVLLCGLVVDHEPHGPYKMLTDVVRTVPLRIRLTSGEPQVLPVHIDDMTAAIEKLSALPIDGHTYRIFGEPLGFNLFMAQLEGQYARKRLPLQLSANLIKNIVGSTIGRYLLPASLGDKVLTFLHKDTDFLLAAKIIPGLTIRSFSETN